jgi:transposase, IS5 family
MVRRPNTQIGLADALVYARVPHNDTLDRIHNLVDWRPLQERMEASYRLDGPGRPGWPVLVMFKALLLQTWYNLSDPATEEALADRLSFRRFTGLALDEAVPDHSTLHRFRDRLEPILNELFNMVIQQLQMQGLILKRGTLVDATLLPSAARTPAHGPHSADRDAAWVKKNGQLTYGSKGHIGTDQDSQIICRADLTPANVDDRQCFCDMVSGDEASVYADKGYFSYKLSDWLKKRGIGDGIMVLMTNERRDKPPELVARNKAISQIRRAVERIFATLKRHYGWTRCRYYSLGRNRVRFRLSCLCYDLRRVLSMRTIPT